MLKPKILALMTLVLVSLVVLTACSKSPEERTCEHYYQEVFKYIAVFTGPTALAELKKQVGELDEIAQEAEPDIETAASKVRDVVTASHVTNSEENLEAVWALEAVCDRRGYDYDHFHPNQVIE